MGVLSQDFCIALHCALMQQLPHHIHSATVVRINQNPSWSHLHPTLRVAVLGRCVHCSYCRQPSPAEVATAVCTRVYRTAACGMSPCSAGSAICSSSQCHENPREVCIFQTVVVVSPWLWEWWTMLSESKTERSMHTQPLLT